MVLGVDHPYEVKSDDTPSLLPDHAIAVRFHSVGGWGAITTGKNLADPDRCPANLARRLCTRARLDIRPVGSSGDAALLVCAALLLRLWEISASVQ